MTSLGSARIGLFVSPAYPQRTSIPRAPADLETHHMVGLSTLRWPG